MVRSYDQVFVRIMIVTMAICCGCAQQKQQDDYYSQWDGRNLTDFEQIAPYEQLAAYKSAAYSGSGPAANALSVFYMKADKTGNQEIYWNAISAENGDPVGQFNLAQSYLDKNGRHYSPHRAKFWLIKASDQGDTEAKKMLAELTAEEAALHRARPPGQPARGDRPDVQ